MALNKVAAPVVSATKPFITLGGAAKATELALNNDEIAYLEEPYVPHNLVGRYGANTPETAKEQHVRSAGNQRNLKGELKMDLHKNRTPNLQSFEYFSFQKVPNEEGRQLPEKYAIWQS